MPKIKVHNNNTVKNINFTEGASLLQILQNHNYKVEAPCGGNGTCGKCRVKIKQVGFINSCEYYPDADIEVLLPNEKESQILTAQHHYVLKLPAETSALVNNISYPVGLAVDLGTTSIVFYWINLITGSIIRNKGISNPQVKYGADVISRINYCTSESKIRALQKEVVNAINHQIEQFCSSENVPAEYIVKVSVSANTTMLHLLAGIDPTPIALAPFKAPFADEKLCRPKDLNINMNDSGVIHLLPSISAYVGADIVAGLASLQLPENIKNYLFIDIGTNGEMALVTPSKIYYCATAAGPAFEGANIYCGMGAFDGAISTYSHDGYQTISDAKPIGICGSGLIDVIAYMLDKGIIQSEGVLNENYVLVSEEDSGNNQAIVITPRDVREIQLAKSAIFTGIKILAQEARISLKQFDAVFLAGGFGNYMNPLNAVKTGILPREVKDKIILVGNTSGAGAILKRLNNNFDQYTKKVIKKSQLVELTTHPEFEMEFAMNMFFQ
jgi:uncharacterized 2Fe-2S/4Fe-4S cluster protein (DUF4445 family)